MFMKFLLTVAVIAIIWFGFKHLQRMAEMKQRRAERSHLSPSSRGRSGAAPASDQAEEMVQCRVCGIWQPGRTVRSCGRKDCPY